jgi:Holliday junction resolvasome RuvABC endonuclease subunit
LTNSPASETSTPPEQLDSELWVWGVDPSLYVPAIGAAASGRRLAVRQVDVSGAATADTLRRLRLFTYECALELMADCPPVCVYIEQPSGRFHNLSLVYATGVIMEAISAAADRIYPYDLSITVIPRTEWCKEILNNALAPKEDVDQWLRRDMGFVTPNLDQAEACAIAIAGWRMTEWKGK